MMIVYFKMGASPSVQLSCTLDGRIDFSILGRKFKLDPTIIELNGVLYREDELKSEKTWEQIKAEFEAEGCTLGGKEDSVIVGGEATVPAVSTGLEGGMQIELKSGEPVESDHPLSQFVACLRDPRLQKDINDAKPNSVIELPKGIVWLGDEQKFSNQLFMRPCYFELLEAKEEYFKLNSTLSAIVYTGTPGIGKSHLCAFVVARKLIEDTLVFFERAEILDKSVEERVVYSLHFKSRVRSFQSSRVLDSVLRNQNVVYIVDGVFAGFPRAHVETHIFASPSKVLYRPEKKVWPSYLYLHTPLFDLEELQSMLSTVSAFQNVSKEDLDEWFMAAGGVARTMLKKASMKHRVQNWKAEAQNLILNMQKDDIEKVVLDI